MNPTVILYILLLYIRFTHKTLFQNANIGNIPAAKVETKYREIHIIVIDLCPKD